MRRVVAVVAGVVLVAGCGGGPGRSVPTIPSATRSVAPTGLVLPPRPRDVRLDGIDPCSLITAAQRTELGVQGEGRASTETAPAFAGPACSWRGYEPRSVEFGVALSLRHGIGVVTSSGATDIVVAIEVDGFPSVLARPTESSTFCSVDVDIGPDQFLDLIYNDGGGSQADIPQDELCRGAQQAAAAAVTTLVAR